MGLIPGSIRRKVRTTPASGDTTVLHEVTFTNTSGSSSTGFIKFGLAFEKMDVPTGQIPKVRIQGGANLRGYPIDIATWNDGSIRKCTIVVDIGTLAGSASRIIEVYNEAGTVPASSLNPVTYVAGLADDATVAITSRTGSATGAMGDLTFSLKTASSVSTKRETQEDTDLFVRYFCWQKLAGEEHLVCLNYLDIWLDTDGSTVVAYEWVPVLSQHWWVNDPEGVVQTKERYTYNVAVAIGASTVDSRTALAHAYYCRWASLYSTNDAQHATPHWKNISSAKPTLSREYSTASRKKMVRAGGYVPPLDWTETVWTSSGTGTYTPLGTNNHRAQINNGGGYDGRGQITRFDANAIALQTSTAWRIARVSAQAGLSVYTGMYDHRVIDIQPAPRLIPTKFSQLGAQTYTGLGTEIYRAKGTSFNSGKNELPHDVPVGGTGSFSGYDNDHSVPYAAFVAFIEGEKYLQDVQLCMADMSITYSNLNVYGHDKSFEWSQSLTGNALGIPLTPFHGTIPATGGIRGRAWGGNNCFWSWALVSDNNPHQLYFEKLLQNYDDFMSDSYVYMSEDHKAYGAWLWNEPQYNDVWMHNWISIIYSQWRPLAIDAGFGDGFQKIAHMSTKLMMNAFVTDRIGSIGEYNNTMPCGTGPKPRAATGWIVGEQALFIAHTATWSGSTYTNTQVDANYPIANGDRFILTASNSSDGVTGLTWPSELSWSTVYYVVNLSGNTFQLSSTLGGSPITLTGSGTTMMALDKASYNVVTSPADVGGDSRYMFALAAVVAAYLDGTQNVSLADVTRYKTFMSTSTKGTYAPWNYSEEQT